VSYKYIELILIITAAFLILNKLFKTLGQVDEDDVIMNKIKNPPKNIDATIIDGEKVVNYRTNEDLVKKFVVAEEVDRLQIQLNELSMKTSGSFNLATFMDGLKKAVPMILSASMNKNEAILKMLIDQRFIAKFQELLASNQLKLANVKNYNFLISDVYFFANSAFIQIAIFCQGILIEKWVFSHNTLNSSKEWLLSNIDND
jgi:hypothetical protein